MAFSLGIAGHPGSRSSRRPSLDAWSIAAASRLAAAAGVSVLIVGAVLAVIATGHEITAPETVIARLALPMFRVGCLLSSSTSVDDEL